MNRRNAIKNLSLGLGYAVAAPAVFNILSSCTEPVETWKSVFLSNEEKHMVTHLVDIILPASDIPGALDVNVPQFIDKMFHNIEGANNQQLFKQGASVFADKFKTMFDKNILKGSIENIEQLFETNFKLSAEDSEMVRKEQYQSEDTIDNDRKSDYFMYKFLFSVRSYALFGYFTSEKVGKEVLNYDPVPGSYQGCVPLKDIGNAWSL